MKKFKEQVTSEGPGPPFTTGATIFLIQTEYMKVLNREIKRVCANNGAQIEYVVAVDGSR